MDNQSKTEVKNFVPADTYSALFQAPVVEVLDGQWPVVLNTLEIKPSPAQFPEITNNVLLKRHYETKELLSKTETPVRFLGYAPLFSETRIYHGLGCDWAMMYLGSDPAYTFYNKKLYAPQPVITDIKNIEKAGFKFDAIFIAHEIPTGIALSGGKVPVELIMPPPPPKSQPRLKFIEDSSKGFWDFVKGVLSMPVKATIAVGTAATLANRDPILFGVQFDTNWKFNEQPIGMWYYLTHWYW